MGNPQILLIEKMREKISETSANSEVSMISRIGGEKACAKVLTLLNDLEKWKNESGTRKK